MNFVDVRKFCFKLLPCSHDNEQSVNKLDIKKVEVFHSKRVLVYECRQNSCKVMLIFSLVMMQPLNNESTLILRWCTLRLYSRTSC